jgi:hypothetical protein
MSASSESNALTLARRRQSGASVRVVGRFSLQCGRSSRGGEAPVTSERAKPAALLIPVAGLQSLLVRGRPGRGWHDRRDNIPRQPAGQRAKPVYSALGARGTRTWAPA